MFFESPFPGKDWPEQFETLLKTNTYPEQLNIEQRTRSWSPKKKQKFPLKTFYGSSKGIKPAHFYGRIRGLPEQQGIPGFQSLKMIKFYHNSNGERDPGQLWGYEGCILPGGGIIVGRWWDMTNQSPNAVDVLSGPFIWWNVQKSGAEPAITSEEARAFLEQIF
jgi:hypothetical protein